jgi:hypothetical protein
MVRSELQLKVVDLARSSPDTWLRGVNEKSSISQEMVQLKALQRKNRNMERAIGAPVIASAIVPIPPTSHSGSLPTASQPVPYVSQHQPRTFYSEPEVTIDQEPVTELITSNQPESSRISSSTIVA